jgi:hypothetical protein
MRFQSRLGGKGVVHEAVFELNFEEASMLIDALEILDPDPRQGQLMRTNLQGRLIQARATLHRQEDNAMPYCVDCRQPFKDFEPYTHGLRDGEPKPVHLHDCLENPNA